MTVWAKDDFCNKLQETKVRSKKQAAATTRLIEYELRPLKPSQGGEKLCKPQEYLEIPQGNSKYLKVRQGTYEYLKVPEVSGSKSKHLWKNQWTMSSDL